MKVNIYDVAKKSGVSVVTVSRVINNATTVRRTSKEKVMKAITELDYHPSVAARNLARGRTNVIGLIVSDLADPFLMEVVKTVDFELDKVGYSLVLSIIGLNGMDPLRRSNFIFQQGSVDGILILTSLFEADYILSLQKKKIPFVILDNQIHPYTVPSIVIDSFKGAYDVTKHLIDTNHQRIAYIDGSKHTQSSIEKYDGFVKALKEVGMKPIVINRAENTIETGYDIMTQWLDEGGVPDAIFATDDLIAFGIIDDLRERGYKVPDDVSVVGYGDHPFCDKLHPKLTTVKIPAVDIGQKGVEILMKIITGDIKRNVVIKIEPHLMKRESVRTKII